MGLVQRQMALSANTAAPAPLLPALAPKCEQHLDQRTATDTARRGLYYTVSAEARRVPIPQAARLQPCLPIHQRVILQVRSRF